MLLVSLILLGMMATVRAQVSVNFIYESMRKDHFSKTYTLVAMSEAIVGVGAVLYFKYLSKDYFNLLLTGYIFHFIGIFGSFFWQESPRYLIKSGQIEKASEVL